MRVSGYYWVYSSNERINWTVAYYDAEWRTLSVTGRLELMSAEAFEFGEHVVRRA